jgi:cysteine-rich repeat protein
MRRSTAALVALFFAVALSSTARPAAAADAPLYRPIRRLTSPEPRGFFGWALAAMGDRLVVGEPHFEGVGATTAHAYVFDPGTGALVHALDVETGTEHWWRITVGAVGDDPLVGIDPGEASAGLSGPVTMFDGATGGIVKTFCCLGAVAMGVDDDVLIGTAGGAELFDPLTGNLARSFVMPDPNRAGVLSMVRTGHTIAIAGAQPVGVRLFDDRTGKQYGFVGTRHGDTRHFGSAMAVNGSILAITEIPQVNVFDIGFGAYLGTIDPPPQLGGSAFGTALAYVDGFLAVGAPSGGDKGAVHLHYANGLVFETLPAAGAGPQFGRALAPLGRSLAVGAPTDDGGAVIIYSPCGDGVTDPPVEQCDDGNQTDDDGCDADCRIPGANPTPAPTPEPDALCGDADGDGTRSVSDGVQVLRAAAALGSVCTLARCDVDANGTIGVTDAVQVLRLAAGLPANGNCSNSSASATASE